MPPSKPPRSKAPRKQAAQVVARNNRLHAEGLARRRQVIEMKLAGASNDEIAEQMGISSGRVGELYREGLDSIPYESVEQERKKQVRQIDRLLTVWWPKALGAPARQQPDGTIIPAREASAGAVDRVVRLLERRAKLTGVDAPLEITGLRGGPIQVQVEAVVAQGQEIAQVIRTIADRQRAALLAAGVPSDVLEAVWREDLPEIMRSALASASFAAKERALEVESTVVE